MTTARWQAVLAPLQGFFDALEFDVWARDLDGRIVLQNEASRRKWGDQLGRTVEESELPADVQARWSRTNKRVLGGEVVRELVNYTVDAPDGAYLAVLAPLRDDGRITGTIGVNVDLTQKERDAAARRRQQELLDTIFRAAPMALSVREVRGDDLVHLCDSAAAVRLMAGGRPLTSLEGLTDAQLGCDPDAVRRTIARGRQSRAGGAPLPFELAYPHPNGARILAGRIAALEGELPLERYVLVGEEATDDRQLQALLVATDRLASLGAASPRLGAEVRNPASYARVHLQWLGSAIETAKKSGQPLDLRLAQEAVQVALEGVDRVIGLVRGARRLSQRGPADDRALESCDLGAAVRGALELGGPALKARARFVVDVPVLPAVRGSALQLGQVVLNLVMNAVTALEDAPAREGRGHGQGTVRLTATPLRDGEAVQLLVEDDGPGLAAEVRTRVFEPFVTTRLDRGATGLGLYVVRRTVEELGGEATLEEPVTGGVRVRLRLRAA